MSDSSSADASRAAQFSAPDALGHSRSAVLRQAWSVGVATGAYGVSFGALSVAAGLSIGQTQVLSLLMFSGASQFAFVSIAGAAVTVGGLAAAVGTAALLGIRNGFYAVAMNPVLGVRGPRKLAGAQLTIDESMAVSSAAGSSYPGLPAADQRALAQLGFWQTGIAVFTLWNAATLIGAVLGDQLGDPRRYGLDAAAAAAFIALLWPRLQERTHQLVAAVAVSVALALAPLTPAGIPVLAAAGVAVLWAVLSSENSPEVPAESTYEPEVGS